MNPSNNGTHGGYAGPGTFILKDGERVAVDPVTLAPLPAAKAQDPAPAPAAEKTKPAAKATEKAVVDATKPE